MRQYIDIISESPIADFGVVGDSNSAGSFRDDDLKAAANPKWQANLEKMFSTVKADMNVYFLNVPNNRYDNDVAPLSYPQGIGKVVNFDTNAGVYSAEAFEKYFGFLPPNYQNSINVLFSNNEGDARIPMTPWMVGHRLMHVLGYGRGRRVDNDIYLAFDMAFSEVRNACRMIADHRKGAASSLNKWRGDGMSEIELWALYAPFKSAKMGRIERVGELYMEFCNQYFLKGSMNFQLKSIEFQGDHYWGRDHNGETTKVETSAEVYRLRTIAAIKRAEENLDECLRLAVGKLFVF